MPSYIPEKLGYNFVKWVRLDMDTEVIISMVMPANDVTVKAVWESNPYQYVLDFDGGSLPNPPSGTIGTPNGMYLPGTVITLPVDIPVRMDYDFNGWQRNDTNVIVAGSFVMPANDVIVKAS
ncbi:MAG: InlB B-repeat-containing protein [Tannerella sp.]|jgi:uncharacterized repeat protein (TIGR02543 family)|nr:InlB B-repeat-containing protein [Tannerella sp.]